jgi:phage shock protein PspC (stress-responsive transcriptional regulator)
MTTLFFQFWVLVLLAFLGGSIVAMIAAWLVFPHADALRERAGNAGLEKLTEEF